MMTKDKGRFFQRYEQLELLCKRIIDAPATIDANTQGELQEAAMKYANALNPDDPQQVFEVLYHDQDGLGRLVRAAVEVVGKADDDDERVTKADRVGHHALAAAITEHAVERLASLRQRHGFEKAHEKEKSTMDDNLTSILKSHDDLMSFCKRAVEDGETRGVSETALVEAVTKHACARFPNERGDAAFSKLWNASTPEGLLLRKTARLCRDGAWGYASAG